MSSESRPNRAVNARRPATLPTPKPLALAVRALLIGGTAIASPGVFAVLPVPADVLVAAGRGQVLPPVINGNTMTIKQVSEKAILDWKSFDIGRENAVRFDQPGKTSVALNNIHQNGPSQILGRLTANGQIYLVNQNGFFFGKDARVDANSMVVSTLRISDEALQRGLSKVITVNGEAALNKDPGLTGKFEVYRQDPQTGAVLTDAQGAPVKREIAIERGAELKAQAGGRIMIFAPAIENRGSIKTPDGQTILAAATDKVYLQEANSDETGVRGLLVEVATGGSIKNLGEIAARRGNVTLAGFAVNQEGLVSATTSVRLNGSVRLLAREKRNNPVDREGSKFVLRPNFTDRPEALDDGLGKSARVVFGQGSVTEVRPEVQSRETAVDEQKQAKSRIEVMGKQVELRESAQIVAPSGQVAVAATVTPGNLNERRNDPEARLDMRLGSRIDVAGLKGVKVPVSKNIVEVELRSFELRDAPLQKDKSSPIYGQKVYVDIRDSHNGRIPLADISGSIARIERNVAERSTTGGSISLSSAGSTRIGHEATLDVSGGTIDYQGGRIKTTWLEAGRRVFEVSKADPNLRYDGIFGSVSRTDRRWNQTQTWQLAGPVTGGRYERGYTAGADGGRLDIRTDSLELEGSVRGQVVDGPFQRSPSERAAASALDIELGYSLTNAQPVALIAEARSAAEQIQALTERFKGLFENPLLLTDRALQRSGFGTVTIGTRGPLAVTEAAELRLPAGGSLSLHGRQIDLAGRISAPGGHVALKTEFDTGRPVPGLDGELRVAPGAKIDVAGLWANDLEVRNRRAGGNPTGLTLVDGGQVNLTADGDLRFEAGAEISADGGAWLDAGGRLREGKGGSIGLTSQIVTNTESGRFSADLDFQGSAHAYAVREGGTLSLASNEILVGDSFASLQPNDPKLSPLVLSPELFQSGGFGEYRLHSNLRGVTIGYDTTVTLQSDNLVLKRDYQSARTGTAFRELTEIKRLDAALRQPTDLELSLKQAVTPPTTTAAVRLDPGSRVIADPGANIRLQTDSKIEIKGEVNAPAGTIQLQVKSPSEIAFNAGQGIFIGDGGRLLAPGAVLPTAGGLTGSRDDRVLPGGSISLEANRGYVVLAPGSELDVSGTAAVVDQVLPLTGGPGSKPEPVVHASAAGSIRLSAPEGILAQGRLLGTARRRNGAEGGSLSLTLQTALRDAPGDAGLAATFPNTPRIIEVRQTPLDLTLADWRFGDPIPGRYNGLAQISAEQIQQGGFDSLTLRTGAAGGDRVRFVNDVNLATGRQLVLETPTIALTREAAVGSAAAPATSTVQLDSTYVALGSGRSVAAPVGGASSFTATARDLEVHGALRFEGVSETRLAAAKDLRLRGVNIPNTRDFLGELRAAGNLSLAAEQIYPSTLSQFKVSVQGTAENRLDIYGTGRPGPVLSAGGQLSLEAPNIDVSGVIKAPFGKIGLTADGGELRLRSGASISVSGRGQTIPFGTNQGGIDWLFTLPNNINLVYGVGDGKLAPPSGSVTFKAASVDIAEGAKLDISGGGQLYSHEFRKGSGGSVDLLDPADPGFQSGEFTYQEKFAILPRLRERLAPYDPTETPKSGLRAGDSIYLAEGAAGLPAGRYTLLPASYALLPGAYLVTPEQGVVSPAPGQNGVRSDGVPLVVGRRVVAGTPFRDFEWSAFAVERGVDFRKKTDYGDYRADSFFAKQAAALDRPVPYLPKDAGSIQIDVARQLSFAGQVASKPRSGGEGGRMDIAADRLRVVAAGSPDAAGSGEVVLSAGQLSSLQVGSLLLGGKRSTEGESQHISVVARQVAVDPGASLSSPELMLTATDRVEVKADARLEAKGQLRSDQTTIRLSDASGTNSDAAFLRVSAGEQAELQRDRATTPGRGALSIENGATLAATGSIGLDASGPARFDGRIELDGGSLWLGANRINLGAVPDGTAGLSLSGSQLAGLKMDRLVLRSATDLASFGDFTVSAKEMEIRAGNLVNGGGSPATASFAADRIRWLNPAAAQSATTKGTGGTLTFKSKTFEFGGGDLAVHGFDNLVIEGSEQVSANGSTRLTATADLHLSSPVLTAGNGAELRLDATGHDLALTGGTEAAAKAGGIGARIELAADSVLLDSKVLLPSGVFEATAVRDLSLGSAGTLDLAGLTQTFAGKAVGTPGGHLRLTSTQGQIDLRPGSAIDVSGPGQAGSVSLAAPEGSASLGARFKGTGGADGGAALAFDVARFADQGVAAFGYLDGVGTARSFSLRVHEGDLAVAPGAVLKAHAFDLSADRGAVSVAGTLDASGSRAGSIALSAGDEVRLNGTARLLASTNSTNAAGGEVFLNSVDQDGDGASGVSVAAGAVIDVRGGRIESQPFSGGGDQLRFVADGPTVRDPATGVDHLAGTIHLRGLRDRFGDGSGRLGIDFQGSALGTETVIAEAVQVHSASRIDAAKIAEWQAETKNYMASPAANPQPGLTVVPGLEIRSSGDLTLASTWDFRPVRWVDQFGAPITTDFFGRPIPTDANGKPIVTDEFSGTRLGPSGFPIQLALDYGHQNDWRYGAGNDLPGFLTLRAGGNLNLTARLTDAVSPGEIDDGAGTVSIIDEMIQPGRSWSFRLVAGSDPAASNPNATLQGVGNLDLGAAAAVRTGTGDITVRAGKDLRLGGENSAIYTVGKIQLEQPGRFGAFSKFDSVWNFYAEYPTAGGDIDIAAGGDIVGAVTRQFVPDWLVRTGNSETGVNRETVAWGVAISQGDQMANGNQFNIPEAVRGFKQNVGALAGGTIRIDAGGAIRDLSAVIPTVGKPLSSTANQIEVHGGGRLEVSAGGDILGGSYYVGKGEGRIQSDGAIRGGQQFSSGPLFALGDADLSVSARSDLAVGTVFDPFLLKERNPTGTDNYFSTYSDSSRVAFGSIAGQIDFANDYGLIDRRYRDLETGASVLDVLGGFRNYAQLYYYPGTVEAVAGVGSITFERPLALAPAPRGNLELFAGKSIETGLIDQPVYLHASDADSVRIPTPIKPAIGLSDFNDSMNPLNPPDLLHGPTPVHTGDTEPVRIVSLTGDIRGNGNYNLSLSLPKQALIEAGRDLRNVNVEIQQLNDGDISRIEAKRDIVFAIRRNAEGALAGGQTQRFRVAGPGAAQIIAGRNVDLGSSDGIVSTGNTQNPALPLSGASLTTVAGVKEWTTDTFLREYLKLSDSEIAQLSAEERLQRALPPLFEALQKAGSKAARTGRTSDYDSGYQAIAALFPQTAEKGRQASTGDINLFFSRIHTIANGDIVLLAPGGTVNAGLTNTTLGQKSSSDLGIVVQQKGAIEAITKNDFTVNESRVFTQGGGSITIWSSDGNIDAGRGAKSALSAPPTQTTFDSQGNLVVIFPPALSGSGIRTASSDPAVPAGDVYLFAPRGVVDAGDAGIGGKNVVIGATAVIGATNISVSGASVGVPTTPPAVVVPGAAAGAGAAATQQATKQVAENAPEKAVAEQEQRAQQALAEPMRAIQVDVFGYGNCTINDIRNGTPGCEG